MLEATVPEELVPIRSLNFQQLDVKGQLAVGGDAGHTPRAISQMGGDGQATLATNGHADNTDVPALDDFILADLEREGLALLVGFACISSLCHSACAWQI